MAPPKPEASATGAKKRRSFFSSNLALMPQLSTPPTRAPVAPRAQVLAALSAPEDVPAARRNVPRAKAPDAATPTDTPVPVETPRRRRRSPPPPLTPITTSSVTTGGHRLRDRSSIKPVAVPEPLTPGDDETKPGVLLKTSIRKTKPTTPQTSLFETKTPKTGKDAHAQSVNERLSQMMLASMRATIQGRTHMYERVPVYTKGKRSKEASSKRSIPLTARQKAKQKAKDVVEEVEDVRPVKGRGKAVESKGKAVDSKGKEATTTTENKEYMTSGFYCQDANAKSPFKLVNKVLGQSAGPSKLGKRKAVTQLTKDLSFPPLPYDHGFEHFFGKEHDFVLPYNIHKDATSGALNDKKKPAPYQKIRANVFPERARKTAERALCKCDDESGCGENCINRIMSYLCGKDCPCGESCTNRSLAKRPMAEVKVKYTGTRGFGLFAAKEIKEGAFVIDYRGEVISLNLFYHRIGDEYAGQKNYYALAYDQDEVIDAGMRGNDARFINHGCDPNLEVKRYQTLGDGQEEYEIGMWATRDIPQGEELFYNYNFDWFGQAKDSLRAECRCGAASCIGFLGRKAGEKSGKEVATEVESKKAADAARSVAKGRKGKVVGKITKAVVKFSSAVERAKKTLATRANRAVRNADEVVEGEDADSHDMEQTAVDSPPRSTNDEGDSEWVDLPVDDLDTAAPEENDLPDSPTPIAADFHIDQTSNDHPENLVRQMINPAAEAAEANEAVHAGNLHLTERLETENAPAAGTLPAAISTIAPEQLSPPVASDTAFRPSPAQTALPASSGTPAASLPSSLGVPAANGRIQPIITPGMTPAEVAAAKRKSGWANWLRKIAAEKTRTLEEWHEERIKRRRGITWMNMMIAEFGVAPSPVPASVETYSDGRKPAGSIGSFANSLAAQGHGPGPEGVRNLGGPKNMYRSDNFGKTKEEQMRASQKTGGGSVNESASDASPVAESSARVVSGLEGARGVPSPGPDGSPSMRGVVQAARELPDLSVAPTTAAQISAPTAHRPQLQPTKVLPNSSSRLPAPITYSQPTSTYPPPPVHSGNFWRTAPIASQSSGAPSKTPELRPAAPVLPSIAHTPSASSVATPETPSAAKESAKRAAIAKRNGAPMGWVYTVEAPSPTTEVALDLPRSARRARQTLGQDGTSSASAIAKQPATVSSATVEATIAQQREMPDLASATGLDQVVDPLVG